MPTPTVSQTLQDPKFYGLPSNEQQKVLARLDPSYARLPLTERNRVLQIGKGKYGGSSSGVTPAPVQQPQAQQPQTGLWGGVGNEIAGAGKGVLSLFRAPETPTEQRIVNGGNFGSLIIYRLGKGEIESRKEAFKQAGQQWKGAGKIRDPLARNLERARSATTAAAGAFPSVGMGGIAAGLNRTADTGNIPELWGRGLVDASLLALGLKPVTGAVTKAAIRPVSRYFPKEIPVGETKIPVLAGEAAPEGSRVANVTERYKRTGGGGRVAPFTPQGSELLERFGRRQHESAREAMRSSLQKSGGIARPSAQETPGGMAYDAAQNLRSQAKPLYQQVDASLTRVPESFDKVSRIMQDAVRKAQDRGAPIGDQLDPVHPFQGVQAIRSELLRQSRALAATDPAKAAAVSQEAENLTNSLETSLRASKNPELYRSWKKANNLWTQYHAMDEVTKALDRVTKGTPMEAQAPGMAQAPTQIQGASLVETLNKLDRTRRGMRVAEGKGDLTAALGPEQARAMRNVADILDRAQRTSVTPTKPLLQGVFYGRPVVEIIRRMGQRPFVNAMTGRGFAYAINKLAESPQGPAAAYWTTRALSAAQQQGNEGQQ
jgi:hypothetical protein